MYTEKNIPNGSLLGCKQDLRCVLTVLLSIHVNDEHMLEKIQPLSKCFLLAKPARSCYKSNIVVKWLVSTCSQTVSTRRKHGGLFRDTCQATEVFNGICPHTSCFCMCKGRKKSLTPQQ